MEWFFLNESKKIKRIAVVGAGISGLQVAKILNEAGFEMKVFEKNKEVGGVWLKNYPGLRLQTPKSNFKIPNHEYSLSLKHEEYPSREEILNYIIDFTKANNLQRLITFNSEITDILHRENDIVIKYKVEGNSTPLAESFDFVILCQGNYIRPYIPKEFKRVSQEVFKGKIFHSSEIEDYHQFKDKNIVIVGYSKSAIDLASHISFHSNRLHVITRHLSWPIPHYWLNSRSLIPHFFHRRIVGDFFFEQATFSGMFHRGWHNHFNFAKRSFWKYLYEIPVDRQYELSKIKLRPEEGVGINFVHHRGFTCNYDFFEQVKKKRIQVELGNIMKIEGDKICMIKENGEENIIEGVDVVILCTGFKPPKFPYFKRFMGNKKSLELFRFTFDPKIPNVAFVGNFTSSMFNCNTAIQSLWLKSFLNKEFTFSLEEIYNDIKINNNFFKNFLNYHKVKNPKYDQVGAIGFNDLLLGDLKISKRRKLLFDSVRRYKVEDYEDIFKK